MDGVPHMRLGGRGTATYWRMCRFSSIAVKIDVAASLIAENDIQRTDGAACITIGGRLMVTR
jgi:hypothetical protein